MAFGDFTLKTVRERFGLSTDEQADLFADVQPSAVPERLRETLDHWASIAVAMNTEKARSKMIIAPLLMEAVSLLGNRVSLFSGVLFDVDRERGLIGTCDYLLSRATKSYFVSHSVFAVVEAKREDLTGGLGQCVAAMVAARIFNEREGLTPQVVHGAVTSGSNWRFLELNDAKILIDRTD